MASVFRRRLRPTAPSAGAAAAPPVDAPLPAADPPADGPTSPRGGDRGAEQPDPGVVARAARPVARVAEGTVFDGRYRLGRLIGEGGMATVHVARDLLLDRDVAIKVFRSRAASKAELRLQEAEAHVIASLNHYALTTLFDAGIEAPERQDPQIYLVMEHVDGTDLRTRLRSGPMEVSEVAWLGFDMSEALDYVHQAGFLHRDIKPANVLLSKLRSAKPVVGKLADFGIASLIGRPDTSEFTTGTAAYLSPEQVEGLDAGPASDVYSLGLVLLEAVTGRVEYPGSIEESAFARLDRDPRIPEHLPSKVAAVLRGMTARDPAARMPLVTAALQLQQYLVDDLIRRREVDAALVDVDEAARLAALRRYDVLDTEPDETFDTITRLAGRLLDAPIALMTLIDLDRVWFKARQGWDEQQVGRDVAFCSTTRNGSTVPWTVADALADPGTESNPLVVDGPRVRSYAGAPLITRDGHNVGALCVFDREPRRFSQQQLDSLADLASLAMHEMEMRLATRRALFSEP